MVDKPISAVKVWGNPLIWGGGGLKYSLSSEHKTVQVFE